MASTDKAVVAADAPPRAKATSCPGAFASRMAARVERPLGDGHLQAVLQPAGTCRFLPKNGEPC